MAKPKTEEFSGESNSIAGLFKALGHPARIEIMKFLATTNSCMTGDLSEFLPLSRTTVNQHLATLKNSGLIQGHILGPNTKYCLNLSRINELEISLGNFLKTIQPQNYECK